MIHVRTITSGDLARGFRDIFQASGVPGRFSFNPVLPFPESTEMV